MSRDASCFGNPRLWEAHRSSFEILIDVVGLNRIYILRMLSCLGVIRRRSSTLNSRLNQVSCYGPLGIRRFCSQDQAERTQRRGFYRDIIWANTILLQEKANENQELVIQGTICGGRAKDKGRVPSY